MLTGVGHEYWDPEISLILPDFDEGVVIPYVSRRRQSDSPYICNIQKLLQSRPNG